MAFHHALMPSRDLEEMERQNERDDEGAHHDDATLSPPPPTTQISSYQHAPSSPMAVHQHPHLLLNFDADKKGNPMMKMLSSTSMPTSKNSERMGNVLGSMYGMKRGDI